MSETPIVAVRGEASVEADPELAKLSVTVTTRADTRESALQTLHTRTADVRAELDRHGAAIERRESSALQVHPELTKDNQRVAAYVASLGTTVTVTDFAALGDLLVALGRIEHAAVYGPWWELRPHSPIAGAARRAAVDDAVVRAREYAAAVGAQLDQLLSISDSGLTAGGYGGGTRMALAEISAPELEPARQTVSASVEMRFTMTAPTVV
ncbi:hypothetical protein GCM10010124_06780 [Pilimelia terevasa]|uniref:SIMPL domain-containing protein n=1 Tax=Pilimelia terevasa TaxID=53372 RepID=A0A8J3BL38_9ACTN|nr:SIMPL domain-containing protein [Pilimelia terevasa]GGK16859.1 hypothetical protein GCM10010124_06780 [Pilimelia terevasa]